MVPFNWIDIMCKKYIEVALSIFYYALFPRRWGYTVVFKYSGSSSRRWSVLGYPATRQKRQQQQQQQQHYKKIGRLLTWRSRRPVWFYAKLVAATSRVYRVYYNHLLLIQSPSGNVASGAAATTNMTGWEIYLNRFTHNKRTRCSPLSWGGWWLWWWSIKAIHRRRYHPWTVFKTQILGKWDAPAQVGRSLKYNNKNRIPLNGTPATLQCA